MTKRILYELTGAENDRQFSPYCWRSRMALAHKGLTAETVPWRFTEKEAIGFSGQSRVPVLVDGDHTVFDSWTIAVYLEKTYPDRPSLFGGTAAMAVTRFINAWTDRIMHAALAPLIIQDIFACLHEKDRAYFRQSREAAFGTKLENVGNDRDTRVTDFRKTLEPLRTLLGSQPFIGGEAPNYADYIPFGAFQWSRSVSAFPLLDANDPITAWRERLLNAMGGIAQKTRAFG